MKESTRNVILEKLNNNAVLNDKSALAPPTNYPSLRKNILYQEFQRERDVLRNMLKSPATFAAEFKERCRWRSEATDRGFGFNEIPESPTNRLYWEIAALVFEPPTLSAMLSILLPSLKTCIDIHFEFAAEDNAYLPLKDRLKRLELVVKKLSIDTLKQLPHIKYLNQGVFTRTHLLGLNVLRNFPLALHSRVKQRLVIDYPLLAEQLDTHNSCFQSLAADILTFNRKGCSPRVAIEQLIHGLTLGGNRITGHAYANSAADEAVKQFFTYFNALTEDTKNQLRALKAGRKTLGGIIDRELTLGQCVETTATYLARILQCNTPHPLLDSPPMMTPEALKALEAKYHATSIRPVVLDTLKNDALCLRLPKHLTKIAIHGISPKSQEELVLLILNFPPQFYKLLWKHLNLPHPESILLAFGRALHDGFYHPEQRLALAKAIAKYYHRFAMPQSLLLWAVRVNDPVFMHEALKSYAADKDLELAMPRDSLGNTPLHYAVDHPASLTALVNAVPVEKRMALFKVINNRGITAVHYAAKKANPLSYLLASLPAPQQLEIIRMTDRNGDTLLHRSVTFSESLKAVCACIPAVQLGRMLLIKNKKNETVFDLMGLAALKIIVAHLPLPERLGALNRPDGSGSPRIHQASPFSVHLLSLVELLPEEQRLAAVETTNTNGMTLLHQVSSSNDCFLQLLALIPRKHRLAALMTPNRHGSTVLHHIALHHVYYFHEVMHLLPLEQLWRAVNAPNAQGLTPLHYAMQTPHSLKNLVILLPEAQRLTFLNTRIYGKTIAIILLENKVSCLAAEEVFKNSFIPELMIILDFLLERAKSQQGILGIFSTKDTLPLLTLINESHDIVEIKYHVFEFISKKPRGLGLDVLRCLVPHNDSVYEMLNDLRQKWDLKDHGRFDEERTPLVYTEL